jgi:hypothetical protein
MSGNPTHRDLAKSRILLHVFFSPFRSLIASNAEHSIVPREKTICEVCLLERPTLPMALELDGTEYSNAGLFKEVEEWKEES